MEGPTECQIFSRPAWPNLVDKHFIIWPPRFSFFFFFPGNQIKNVHLRRSFWPKSRDLYSNKVVLSKVWSLQLWTQLKQLRIEAWKSQDFNGIWTRDLAIPVRRSNQLSYEATDVAIGSWSFVSSNEPVKNGCKVM